MPIFEYTCKACTHRFETLVRGSQAPVCPDCGSRKLQKELSVFAVAGQSSQMAPPVPTGPCASCDSMGAGGCPWK